MKNIPVYFIDTFTSEKFKGNPTAVCIVTSPITHENMQAIARELYLPVTAFVELPADTTVPCNIYYFTTVTEIFACEHATLAAGKAVAMIRRINSLT